MSSNSVPVPCAFLPFAAAVACIDFGYQDIERALRLRTVSAEGDDGCAQLFVFVGEGAAGWEPPWSDMKKQRGKTHRGIRIDELGRAKRGPQKFPTQSKVSSSLTPLCFRLYHFFRGSQGVGFGGQSLRIAMASKAPS